MYAYENGCILNTTTTRLEGAQKMKQFVSFDSEEEVVHSLPSNWNCSNCTALDFIYNLSLEGEPTRKEGSINTTTLTAKQQENFENKWMHSLGDNLLCVVDKKRSWSWMFGKSFSACHSQSDR